ncbi:MAG: hypothetical protein DLM56_07995 [Pseudonocardiales bacterium]|nr:MAG: hypothetical protein DLM56_07995 [Pseudonocardiales bacterium]
MVDSPKASAERGEGGEGGRDGEVRFPAVAAIVVAIALYTLLPGQLIVGPRIVVPVLEGCLLAASLAANPRRLTRQNRALRILSLTVVGLIAASNTGALILLVDQLITAGSSSAGTLLLAALQVWATNVIVFGLLYWELDRGGPVTRRRAPRREIPPADFRFSQDENHDAVGEVAAGSSKASGWLPGFVDYLYVSTTNSTAFSPTDTMPLTPRAKLLMAYESISALIVSLLVVARAVSALH